MNKDKELIIDFIKETTSAIYDKEVFFYDDELNKWYSRIDCEYIELEEVLEWLKQEVCSLMNK